MSHILTIFASCFLLSAPLYLLGGTKPVAPIKMDKGFTERTLQGERGLQGLQGPKGEKGDKGDKGEAASFSNAYGYVFKMSNEEIYPYSAVIFESISALGKDISYDLSSGVVTVLEDGDYLISYYVNSTSNSLLTFGVCVNGTSIAPGSVYKVTPVKFVPIVAEKISPLLSGQLILSLKAGNTFELVNLSDDKVIFNNKGPREECVNASLFFQKLN
jgi:hypothetical protein